LLEGRVSRNICVGLTTRWLLRLPILVYRYSLSALLGAQCRYEPTCSAYADEAIARHGAWPGLWIGAARLCRCHPLGPAGWDPVPERLPPDARRYKPWRYGRWTGRHMRYRLDRLG
jgi:putative membrane protein insertion efficiency factor